MKIRSFIKLCAKIYKTKAAKVALLGVCSTMLLVSSGASFAKYYSENGFGDNASLAKLGAGNVYFDYERAQVPAGMGVGYKGIYAYMASFRVEFETSEVERCYSLDLRISKKPNNDYTVEDYPDQNSFTIDDPTPSTTSDYPTVYTFKTTLGSNNSGTSSRVTNPLTNESSEKKWLDMASAYGGIDNFSYNTIYCAYSTESQTNSDNTVSGKNFKWVSKPYSDVSYTVSKNGKNLTGQLSLVKNGNIVSNSQNETELPISFGKSIHFFKVVMFSELIDDNGSLVDESVKILSKLTLTQESGGN